MILPNLIVNAKKGRNSQSHRRGEGPGGGTLDIYIVPRQPAASSAQKTFHPTISKEVASMAVIAVVVLFIGYLLGYGIATWAQGKAQNYITDGDKY